MHLRQYGMGGMAWKGNWTGVGHGRSGISGVNLKVQTSYAFSSIDCYRRTVLDDNPLGSVVPSPINPTCFESQIPTLSSMLFNFWAVLFGNFQLQGRWSAHSHVNRDKCFLKTYQAYVQELFKPYPHQMCSDQILGPMELKILPSFVIKICWAPIVSIASIDSRF